MKLPDDMPCYLPQKSAPKRMRFELLAVFDSTDSPNKNHPCAGFALDTKPPCSEGFIHFHINRAVYADGISASALPVAQRW